MGANQQALLGVTPPTGSSNGLLNNLVSYYKLDSNANDSHGSNNGTATSMSYVSGKINDAGSFNGTTAYITLPVGVFPVGNCSYSFWIYVNNRSGEVFTDWRGAKKNIYFYLSSNTILVFRGNGGTSQSASPTTSSSAIANNTWTHVVFTQSGTTGTVYLNGTSAGTSNLTYTGGTTGYNNYLFSYENPTPTQVLIGDFDEFGVWNTVLTTDQITALYNSGSGLAYSSFTS